MAIECVTSSLYDDEKLVAGRCVLFQNPIGAMGKQLCDTNMMYSGRLYDGHEFLVRALFIRHVSPLVHRFFIGDQVFGEFKLWADNKIDVSQLHLTSGHVFRWESVSCDDTANDRVYVTMLGNLYRRV